MRPKVNYLELVKYCADSFRQSAFLDDYIVLLEDNYMTVFELLPDTELDSNVKTMYRHFMSFRFRFFYYKKTKTFDCEIYYSVRTAKKVCFHKILWEPDLTFQHTWHF